MTRKAIFKSPALRFGIQGFLKAAHRCMYMRKIPNPYCSGPDILQHRAQP